jgi:hypothetical protein
VKRRRACLIVRFVPLVLWVLAVPVRAEEVSPEGRFSLEIKSCPTVSAASVRRILGIEISDLLLGEDDVLSVAHDRLTIRCVGRVARIEATGPAATTPLEQVLDLDTFPEDAVARALALAGLELLSSLSSTVRARLNTPPPAPPAPPAARPATPPSPPAPKIIKEPPPKEPPPAEPPPAVRDTRVGLAGTWRTFVRDQGASLWGGRLEASTTLGDLWLVAGDVDGAGARIGVAGLGTVDALSFSSALTFGARLHKGALTGNLGVGGRLGLIRLTGKSANPSAVSASSVQHPWGGPMAAACASTRFGRFSLMLSAEAGYSFLVSDGLAGNRTAVSVGGPWIGLSLGGGFHP